MVPFIDILAASRICEKCLSFANRLRGWFYGDFHPWLKFHFGLPSWKKLKKRLQIHEKIQPMLKIFQSELKLNRL